MSRCLNTRISIPSKARGETKVSSNPILIGAQLPGTFCPVKRHKIGPTSMATEITIDFFFFSFCVVVLTLILRYFNLLLFISVKEQKNSWYCF